MFIIILFSFIRYKTKFIYTYDYKLGVTGFELTHRDSQIAMHFLKYAMQKSTKTNKIAMQVLYAYLSRMLHVCYAYSSRTHIVSGVCCVFFVYVVRILRIRYA